MSPVTANPMLAPEEVAGEDVTVDAAPLRAGEVVADE